ncbi:MAG: 3-hydroxybutyryl-CoA dehydrogenase [Bacteroidetes bacterium]|nr:3-hydroxybutyryl-CoA dehydrogenase [Bacteroidota bacterium]
MAYHIPYTLYLSTITLSQILIMQKICVCGAGTMGSGIAQSMAQNGFSTILFDLNASVIQQAKINIEKNLQGLVEKNKINPQQKNAITEKLYFTSDINDCKADIIVEAIIEVETAKTDLFNRLASINQTETIFATNTSSLSVTAIAKKIIHSERVVGMHFFNPATIMKLVEVVVTDETNENTRSTIVELARKLNKTPVLCKDAPGFIVNHVARPYYIEALRLIEEGISDFETIDKMMENSGFKMGPFRLMDLIGNDINYAVSNSVYEAMGKPKRLKPSPIQEEKVLKKELGRKTGKGYYEYESGE